MRTCPNCGIELQYRLGMYECPRCDYNEPEHPPEPAPEPEPEPKRKRLPNWIPPVSLHDPGLERGTVFNPHEYDEHARIRTAALGEVAQLLPEKVIVLGAMAVRSVLDLILVSPLYGKLAFNLGSGTVILSVLSLIFSLLLWSWVLFSRVIWAKYLFSIIALVAAVTYIGGALMLVYYSLSDRMYPLLGWLPYGVLFWVLVLANAAIFAWAFWILFREIQFLQYRR
jgi:hypothetical protein